ncbi:DUF4878 domain-containing protein [Antrihabitans sp. YC2-6]|uniref:Rv0361 family membrane protein n=1 Tax=Antrihabitans sp. YC2-6 TaxID=2799498 RepID=UPI0018F34C88|nr:DUF4878 domain-containing protein [Antrihabitans sp. YC2-6]MBJ8347300.1 hypothetical protein [Antrihabitans sp. YC2-6]
MTYPPSGPYGQQPYGPSYGQGFHPAPRRRPTALIVGAVIGVVLIVGAIITVVLSTAGGDSAGDDSAGDDEAQVEQALRGLFDADSADEALSYLCTELREDIESDSSNEEFDAPDLKSIDNVEIDGDTASADVIAEKDGEERTTAHDLKKEDGEWLVCG